MDNIKTELDVAGNVNHYIAQLIDRYPSLASCAGDIQEAYEQLLETAKSGGTIYTCGNGGSNSDAQHIVGELMKSFAKPRPLSPEQTRAFEDVAGAEGLEVAGKLQRGLRALALGSQGALSTAFANDVDPDLIFAQELADYVRPGDVLLAISTSGNAKNVRNAAMVARAASIPVILLTGEREGTIAPLATHCISVPGTETYKIQELHLPVYHALCLALEAELF